jgi:hypothetical protein
VILFAMLLSLATVAGQQSPASSGDEISVVGTKLRKLQLDLNVDGGRLSGCRAKVSSGDRFIDEAACDSARSCVAKRSSARIGLMTCINDGVVAAVARERAKEESRNAEN